MNKIVIYCYHCIPTGKKYVGQTINERDRKAQHRYDALVQNSDAVFHRAIRKYGWDSFIYGVIEQTDDINREVHWIEQLNTYHEGYNATTGGAENYIISEESRERMRTKAKGRTHTQETKDKIGASSKGRTLSDSARAKVSAANKGREGYWKGKKLTQEHKDKIGAASKGRVTTKETREKLSIAGKNRKLTDTHKEKVRQYREITYEIEYTNGEVEIVKGLKRFSIERGYSRSTLTQLVSGKRKRHKDIIRVTRIGRV